VNAPLRRCWTLDEEVTIVRMRRNHRTAKMIAREIDRTPDAVREQVNRMKQRVAPRYLAQQRAEEMGLLERLLKEAAQPDVGERQ
jgi:hypothetical protein